MVGLFFLLSGMPAQQMDTNYFQSNFMGLSSGYGFISPHHKSIAYIMDKKITNLNAYYGFRLPNNDIWKERFRNPVGGVGFSYYNLGNPEVLGNAYAVYSYLRIPILKNTQRFSWGYQISFGWAYLNQKFNLDDNIYNVAIGSHNNVFIYFNTNAQYALTEKLAINTEIGFTHFSSGRMGAPNLGINTMGAKLGMEYAINLPSPKKATARPDFNDINKKIDYNLVYSHGLKTAHDFDTKLYYISSVALTIKYRTSSKRKVGFGADLFYDETLQYRYDDQEFNSAEAKDLYRYGLHLSHDFVYKRISMISHLGGYIFRNSIQKEVDQASFYTRVGVQYQFTPYVLTSLTLKSHYAIADYIEWGIGVSL